ncbi:MAG: DUF4843 domain-containing protein [Bacteroidia bacterium]|nr:DUF4843 domain-containing protein [Bacteroidia bacterium]
MKKRKIHFVILSLFALLMACDKGENLMYKDFSGLHFVAPTDTTLILRRDTLIYSFAFEKPEIKEKIIYIPVEIEGFRENKDRKFNVQLIKEGTTAESGVHYEALQEYYTVKANQGRDSIALKVKRTLDIRNTAKTITLKLVPTDEFEVGLYDKQQVSISFSDILEEPDWWENWKYLFGEYHRIKYQEWIKIKGGKGELPNKEIKRWQFLQNYPTECMLIMQLRLYFEKNPRYTLEELADPNNKGERIIVPCPIL